MKKYIKSASTFDTDKMEMQFSMLENEAYNAGYEFWVEDYEISLSPRRGEKYLPDFFISRVDVGDGKFGYDVELQFPTVYIGSDEYADTAEYAVSRFEEAAKLATMIKKFTIDPNEEYED